MFHDGHTPFPQTFAANVGTVAPISHPDISKHGIQIGLFTWLSALRAFLASFDRTESLVCTSVASPTKCPTESITCNWWGEFGGVIRTNVLDRDFFMTEHCRYREAQTTHVILYELRLVFQSPVSRFNSSGLPSSLLVKPKSCVASQPCRCVLMAPLRWVNPGR